MTANQVQAPQPDSTLNGSGFGYRVEARATNGDPLQVGKQIFDAQWRIVRFERAQNVGVLTALECDHGLRLCDLMRYPAAQALRWWLMSEAFYGIETRLMRYRYSYSSQCFKDGPLAEAPDALFAAPESGAAAQIGAGKEQK